jgi:WG containing repeat
MKSIFLITLYITTTLIAKGQDTLMPYFDGNLWGITNTKKEILVKPIYTFIDSRLGTYFPYFLVKENEQSGLIKQTGEKVTPLIYDEIIPMENKDIRNKFLVKQKTKWTIIDLLDSTKKYPQRFDSITLDYLEFKKGLIQYRMNNKVGLLSSDGNIVLAATYSSITSFLTWVSRTDQVGNEAKFAKLQIKNLYHLYNMEKRKLQSLTFFKKIIDTLIGSTQYFVCTNTSNKKSFFNPLKEIFQNTIPNKNSAKDIILDNSSATTTPQVTTDNTSKDYKKINIYRLNDTSWTIAVELRQFIYNNVLGYLSTTNVSNFDTIIPYEETFIKDNSFNKIMVQKNRKFGIINDQKQILIPVIYDQIRCISKNCDVLYAMINNKYGIIDKNNNLLIPLVYSYIQMKSGDPIIFSIKDNDLFGFRNYDKVITKPIIKKLDLMHSNPYDLQLAFLEGGKMGFLNTKSYELYYPE